MKSRITEKLKKEAVLIASFAAAAISCFLMPGADYMSYIDTDTICLLFSLMAIIAGITNTGLLTLLSQSLQKKTSDTRILAVLIITVTFFISMAVTNDAALITFVPFSIMLFSSLPQKQLILILVIQTMAANLGSMVTPMGSPQNIYLYTYYHVTPKEFFSATLPAGGIGLIILLLLCLFIKNEKLPDTEVKTISIYTPECLAIYLTLFFLAILAVTGVINVLTVFASVCVVLAIMEPRVFRQIDYSLLLTFVFFFIFVGNIKNMDGFGRLMDSIIAGREFEVTLISGQFISNVPAAVMASAFTDNFKEVLLGADIGGLGTPVASLASLISLRIYGASEKSDTGKYLAVFTVLNFSVLAAMVIFAETVILK